MAFFIEPVIHKSSNYHVFIGTERYDYEAFQTLKYSILSTSDQDISVILIPKKDRFLVPAKAKELGLHGRAIYMNAEFLLKDDITNLFNLTTDMGGEKLIWVIKEFDKIQYWSDLMVFNLENLRLYEMLEPIRVESWKHDYLYGFQWISRSRDKQELEIGSLPEAWKFIPNGSESRVQYNDIKAIQFHDGGPWLSHLRECKFGKAWWEEYLLFLNNYLLPEVKKYAN